MSRECPNGTKNGCPDGTWDEFLKLGSQFEKDDWLEDEYGHGLRYWHVIFFGMAGALALVILFCCCVKIRIPRTKQEIEGDYIRRKILRKFRKRLKAIHNQELDDMDLKRALDKIRAEFRSDTESLEVSENGGFSVATISSNNLDGKKTSTYRRASQINIDISLEDLRMQTMGLRERLLLGLSRIFGRSRVRSSDKKVSSMEAGQLQLTAEPQEKREIKKKETKVDEKKNEKDKKDKNGKDKDKDKDESKKKTKTEDTKKPEKSESKSKEKPKK